MGVRGKVCGQKFPSGSAVISKLLPKRVCSFLDTTPVSAFDGLAYLLPLDELLSSGNLRNGLYGRFGVYEYKYDSPLSIIPIPHIYIY